MVYGAVTRGSVSQDFEDGHRVTLEKTYKSSLGKDIAMTADPYSIDP